MKNRPLVERILHVVFHHSLNDNLTVYIHTYMYKSYIQQRLVLTIMMLIQWSLHIQIQSWGWL
jgi:hypothetical protein